MAQDSRLDPRDQPMLRIEKYNKEDNSYSIWWDEKFKFGLNTTVGQIKKRAESMCSYRSTLEVTYKKKPLQEWCPNKNITEETTLKDIEAMLLATGIPLGERITGNVRFYYFRKKEDVLKSTAERLGRDLNNWASEVSKLESSEYGRIFMNQLSPEAIKFLREELQKQSYLQGSSQNSVAPSSTSTMFKNQ